MKDLEELRKEYEELGEEIKRLENLKKSKRKYLEKIEIYYELMDLAEELNGEEEIDWDNGEQEKFSIRYIKGKFRNDFYLMSTGLNRNIGSIYCLSADFLKVALERIGADRLKKLF